jgi:hypothetical protein
LERSKQLRNLVDNVRPNTISTISKKQTAQMKRQNSAKNVMSQHLVPGTVGYIKSMRLHAKLQPLYHTTVYGPSRDEHDNYNLKNSLNQVLSKAYPLCHLKVVMTTDETLVVFEKIIENKSNRRGQLEYLVKYVDKPLDEASCVKESHFTSTDLIEEYWSTH